MQTGTVKKKKKLHIFLFWPQVYRVCFIFLNSPPLLSPFSVLLSLPPTRSTHHLGKPDKLRGGRRRLAVELKRRLESARRWTRPAHGRPSREVRRSVHPPPAGLFTPCLRVSICPGVFSSSSLILLYFHCADCSLFTGKWGDSGRTYLWKGFKSTCHPSRFGIILLPTRPPNLSYSTRRP